MKIGPITIRWTKDKHKDRLYDFEGRCEVCCKELNINLRRLSDRGLHLTPVECTEHPGKSHILWPQRDDIEVINP
jgi:hypothetical protein